MTVSPSNPNANRGGHVHTAHTQAAQTTAAFADAPDATQQSQTRRQRAANVLDFSLQHGRTYNTNTTSEQVAGVADFFNRDIDTKPAFKGVAQAIVLDGRSLGLSYSVIALALSCPDSSGKLHAPVHVMIIAGSAPAPIPRTDMIENRETTLRRVPGDMAAGNSGNVLWNRVESAVCVALGGKADPTDPANNVIVYEAGQSVIPDDMTEFVGGILSKASETHCRAVLSSAFEAVIGIKNELFALDPAPTAVDFANAGQVIARIDPEPAAVYNTTGLPIRADISLEVSLVDTQPAQGMERASIVLSEVAGFIEPVYCDLDPVQQNSPNPPTQRYNPRLVLTNFFIDGRITLESVVFALFSARLLAPNYQWAQALKPKFNNAKTTLNNINLADIGAIGMELPPIISDRHAIPLKPGDDSAFFQLIQAAFNNELIYSIDVEETGDTSWVLQTLVEHADGDANATARLVAALDRFTENHFSDCWDHNQQMFVRDGNQVLLGNFTDASGNRRDIRELGYLAILNIYGKDDPDTVIEFDSTFDPQHHMDVRLDKRAVIAANTVGGSIVYTGRANRLNATPEFFEALGMAISRAGLNISPAGVVTMAGGNQRRNAAQFQARGISGASVAAGFSYAQSRTQPSGSSNARGGYGAARRTFD